MRLRRQTERGDDCETRGADVPIRDYFASVAKEGKAVARTPYEVRLAELLASRTSHALEPVRANELGESWFRATTDRLDPTTSKAETGAT